ncbi:sensor histidine kinase [Fontibacillus panacisegetis]|nr:HAMP domain-containing sensor histidine kinase [Fontibacillus panacisegetis]
MKQWMNKWVITLLVSVLILSGCGLYLLIERSNRNHSLLENKSASSAMNQARLLASETMTYLEQHHYSIEEHSDQLQRMCSEQNLNLLLVDLKGNVIFNSDSEHPQSVIDIKTTIYYDHYPTTNNSSELKFVFPVTDMASGQQVANAIFTVPEKFLNIPKDSTTTYIFTMAIIISILIVFMLVILFRRKMQQEMITPVQQLKRHAEVILKGDYEQRVEYVHGGEMGELYSMFDQMRMEIMDLNQRRDAGEKAHKELISNISHDLKTPLATIRAYIEAVRDGVCPDMDTLMEYIQVMHAQSDKMTALIDDLFVHAIRELGQITVRLTEQYSRPLFTQILTPIGHFVATRGVIYEGPDEVPDVLIKADAARIEQVVMNLVTNALKHTSAGDRISIHIEQIIELGPEYSGMQKNSNMLRIAVADTGEGILPKDIPFIFERYYQGQSDKPHTLGEKRSNGSGLGLSICKTIVEAHNGNISFHSSKNQGTTFYFTIPVH